MNNNADKLRKKTIRDQQKRLKPGECQKYVRLVLDHSISETTFGRKLLEQLKSMQLDYILRKLPQRNCIIWERHIDQLTFVTNSDADNVLEDEWQQEDQVLQLLWQQDLLQAIQANNVHSIGARLINAFPGKQHTIVLLYSGKDKQQAHATMQGLIDLEVEQRLATWQLSDRNAQELCELLRRFTKAVAEAPYKQKKSKILHCFKKYLANDKKQCVRVVGTDGFGRLWQQHLTRLPQVTLEIAETIIAQYSCPQQLRAEYDMNSQAVDDIADLRIQRAGLAPLQTERRIGKVLSSKLYTLYNSRDPNELI